MYRSVLVTYCSCFVPDLHLDPSHLPSFERLCRLRRRERGGPEEEPPTSNILSIPIIKSHSHTVSVCIEDYKENKAGTRRFFLSTVFLFGSPVGIETIDSFAKQEENVG